MRKKLKQQNGETLVESLVAVLISVLALTMLAGSLMASARINQQNRKADEKYEADLRYAEAYVTEEPEANTEKVTIKFKETPESAEPLKEGEVTLYSKEEGSFASYKDSITYDD